MYINKSSIFQRISLLKSLEFEELKVVKVELTDLGDVELWQINGNPQQMDIEIL